MLSNVMNTKTMYLDRCLISYVPLYDFEETREEDLDGCFDASSGLGRERARCGWVTREVPA